MIMKKSVLYAVNLFQPRISIQLENVVIEFVSNAALPIFKQKFNHLQRSVALIPNAIKDYRSRVKYTNIYHQRPGINIGNVRPL